MREERGDLLTLALSGRFDVIVHGCNCFCTMGSGIAKAIKEEFPEAYTADLVTSKGDRNKLGTYTCATATRDNREITIVNGYSQYHFHGRGVLVDYPAVRRLFAAIKQDFTGKRIGYPKIGAGLAKGDWQLLAAIIDEKLSREDHTLVLYHP